MDILTAVVYTELWLAPTSRAQCVSLGITSFHYRSIYRKRNKWVFGFTSTYTTVFMKNSGSSEAILWRWNWEILGLSTAKGHLKMNWKDTLRGRSRFFSLELQIGQSGMRAVDWVSSLLFFFFSFFHWIAGKTTSYSVTLFPFCESGSLCLPPSYHYSALCTRYGCKICVLDRVRQTAAPFRNRAFSSLRLLSMKEVGVGWRVIPTEEFTLKSGCFMITKKKKKKSDCFSLIFF